MQSNNVHQPGGPRGHRHHHRAAPNRHDQPGLPGASPNSIAPIVTGLYCGVVGLFSMCVNVTIVFIGFGIESFIEKIVMSEFLQGLPLLGPLLESIASISAAAALMGIFGLAAGGAMLVIAFGALRGVDWAYSGILVVVSLHVIYMLITLIFGGPGIFRVVIFLADGVLLAWHILDPGVKTAYM